MKKKIEDLLKTYHRNGFVKLGRVASISYSKKLSNRIQDLMSGKKQYHEYSYLSYYMAHFKTPEID